MYSTAQTGAIRPIGLQNRYSNRTLDEIRAQYGLISRQVADQRERELQHKIRKQNKRLQKKQLAIQEEQNEYAET